MSLLGSPRPRDGLHANTSCSRDHSSVSLVQTELSCSFSASTHTSLTWFDCTMKEDRKAEVEKPKKGKKVEFKPKIDDDTFRKFARGSVEVDTHKVKSSAVRNKLEHRSATIKEAAMSTASTEVLLPSDPGFIEMDDSRMKVFKLKQKDISDNIDLNTAKNAFDFQLQTFGPYCVNFSRNGRYDYIITCSPID
jgi:hypothetical protein